MFWQPPSEKKLNSNLKLGLLEWFAKAINIEFRIYVRRGRKLKMIGMETLSL